MANLQHTPADLPPPHVVTGTDPISVLEPKPNDSTSSQRVPCDLAIFESKFEIISPGYPYQYPPNADCLYSIRRANSNICKLKLEFIDYDVDSTSSCDGDYLDIEGLKFCGPLSKNYQSKLTNFFFKVGKNHILIR